MLLKNKKILIGITGSIAAYKACEIVRHLQKKGAQVRVCMTPSATEFVGSLTFRALTGEDVLIDWKDGKTGLEHIFWARWADSFVIAPATANTIAKVRTGIADSFLTSVALAYDKSIVFAPAMNTQMYRSNQTQENINILRKWGHLFVEPSEGELACGEEGEGKLAEVEDIETVVLKSILPQYLKNKKVLITAGGTREYFDPIRYISNASSGQMGYALTKIAYAMGGDVTLISAPTNLKKPYGITVVDVISAEDMYREVIKRAEKADVIIMNAAVADFRPESFSREKLKKSKEKSVVHLKPNPDILKKLGEIKKKDQILIGFAAESTDVIENAKDKLIRKNLDYIIANELDVFSKKIHRGWIINRRGDITEIPEMDKESSAFLILEKIFKR
ncbi:bifunctional phosphopantothenoylcysteine decarboxylase/phosphopantothenate--cysteine ligase CoaBC [Persephonella atlantica]|uniref:Coenzyme A biosynthesis bifunctional protein CoaBC n=1 Tax=Persephonella atlantica TaxID=2699429 RepID=A0ABS1GG62_9AQUI|nr:bifunctional phosphopantothenoylcysteine decarboxylase/phosphopantothenate--cysteine ligase CoaBC [Persephonella atlantica]MBK3331767.1 bifunctional phosphopantothenoylcysteine decarboxylase/phosphopantothenate--cysteine ligase CoaBC [Persephonella atlantica]